MVDLSQASRKRHDQRMFMTDQLDKVLEALRAYCFVHFALYDELRVCMSNPCDKEDPVIPWTNYKMFRTAFNFDAFTFCFLCGTPNDTSTKGYYQPQCHLNIKPSACQWKHLVFKTLYIIWHRRDEVRRRIFEHHEISDEISIERFAQWAREDLEGNLSPHYYNGLNMFMSFCHWQTQEGQAFYGRDIFPDL